MGLKFPFIRKGSGKERQAETGSVESGLPIPSVISSELSKDQLTAQEEITAKYYATTARNRSLEDLEADLRKQYSDPDAVSRVLKKITQLWEEKERLGQK